MTCKINVVLDFAVHCGLIRRKSIWILLLLFLNDICQMQGGRKALNDSFLLLKCHKIQHPT